MIRLLFPLLASPVAPGHIYPGATSSGCESVECRFIPSTVRMLFTLLHRGNVNLLLRVSASELSSSLLRLWQLDASSAS